MQADQVYDDVEAVIMAADEQPEYREQIIEGFIDQVLRRRKRRFATWRTTALLLTFGVLGTLFIDRLISFPLSLFAFIFLWIVIIATWVSFRMISVVEHHAHVAPNADGFAKRRDKKRLQINHYLASKSGPETTYQPTCFVTRSH
jgi:hypothetical protein